MRKALKWIWRELLELLPIFAFFSITFSIIVVTDALYVRGYNVHGWRVAGAVLLALIVSKMMLVLNHMSFLEAFPRRPLIFNTVWKTSIYLVGTLWFRYLERVVHYSIEYRGFISANEHMLHEMNWPRFWAIQIWLTVIFSVFVAYGELSNRLGNGKIRRMFFGKEIASEIGTQPDQADQP